MSRLSLDLPGASKTRVLPREAARGAGVSVLLHGLGISTLVLAPLLQSTNAPEVANTVIAPLARPLTVTLPPAPLRVVEARRGSSRARRAPSMALAPPIPKDAFHDLDLPLSPFSDAPLSPDLGAPGIEEGVCPPGTLCGTAVVPIESPRKTTVRIGGLIREPRLIESAAPAYPPVARTAGVAGRVVLEAHVGEDGRVAEVRITEGHPLFDEAATASVRSRRYEPLLLNGVPTEFLITITVAFNLKR